MKKKGTRAERELLHMFWKEEWATIRAAGSGSMPLPAPDLLVGNKIRYLAIECKSIKGKYQFFNLDEINQLKIFAELFGAEPWIGIRFDNKGWFFLEPKSLKETKGGNLNITLNLAQTQGIKFEELIK